MGLFGFGKKKAKDDLTAEAEVINARKREQMEMMNEADEDEEDGEEGEFFFAEEELDMEGLEEGGMIVAQELFAVKERGLIIVGQVSGGHFQVGDKVEVRKFNGEMIATEVSDMEMYGKRLQRVEKGEQVAMVLKPVPGLAMRKGDAVFQTPDEA